jgi:DNA repair protein RadC
MNKKKNPHDGHRERVREKFLKEESLKTYADHNILEMLLFYAIPRADTNELAHRLLNTFGSFSAVFDADISQLLTVDGIGTSTAVLLKMIPSVMQRYYENKISNPSKITGTDSAVSFIKAKFLSESTENIYIMCMNNDGKVLKFTQIASGTITSSEIDSRLILQEMLLCKATTAIIAHNHPSGICAPSTEDVATTRKISSLLASINAKLIDHIIIAGDEYFAFSSHEKIKTCLSNDNSYQPDEF